MHRTKLLKFLLTFSKKERNAFRRFLHSPFHNRDTDLRRLYQELLPILRGEKPSEIAEETIFETVFPEQKPDATLWRNLKHALLKHAKAFLAHQALRADRAQQVLYQLADARNRDGGTGFAPAAQKLEQDWDALPPAQRDADEHWLRYAAAMEVVKARAQGNRRGPDSYLGEAISRLDDFYLLQKLQLACALLNQEGITAATKPLSGPSLAAFWQLQNEETPSLTQFYRLVYQMLTEPEEASHYTQLVDYLFDEEVQLAPDSMVALLTYAINRCVRHINAAEPAAKLDFLDLYKRAKVKPAAVALLLQSPWHRKNLVQVAASLGQIELAREIADFEIEPSTAADTAMHFNRAVIHFYQGKLPSARHGFHQVLADAKDRFFLLDAQVYLMLIEYVQGGKGLESFHDRFRIGLNRLIELTPARKDRLKSFQLFFARLMRVPYGDSAELTSFRARVASDAKMQQHLWALDWLAKLPKA